MTNIREMSRVRQQGQIWLVEIMSAAIGRWIVQGQWKTKESAEADRKNWM